MIKLTYLGRLVLEDKASPRIWNVIEPELPGYDFRRGFPTMTLEGLKEAGLVPK